MPKDLTSDPVQQALDEAIRRCESQKLGPTALPCSLQHGDMMWKDDFRKGRDAGVSLCVTQLTSLRRELAGK